MPRLIPILATFAMLSACCLLLVGGCEERITPEEYAELTALADTIVAQHDTLEATIRGILSYIPYQHCPPCPDSTSMPEGRWVTLLEIWSQEPWPDSAYILKGE